LVGGEKIFLVSPHINTEPKINAARIREQVTKEGLDFMGLPFIGYQTVLAPAS
jgi:hypothetical protein